MQKKAFRQHVVDSQKLYASTFRQNSAPPQPQNKTFTVSAEQRVKFVASVAIQIAQPQVCNVNSPRTELRRNQVCVTELPKLPKPTQLLTSLELACLML